MIRIFPIVILAAIAGFAAPCLSQPAQQVHRGEFTPAGDSVFAVITQFYDFDAVLPLNVRVVDTWETEDARFEQIVFTTSNDERVPADLALPLGGEPPYPAVVLIHGLGNSRDRWWREDRETLPKQLLDSGIAVLTLDLRFHGERAAANDYQSPVFLTMGNSLFVRSRNMGIQSTIDCRRALDVLEAREDIAGGKIAVAGYSMGGMIALRLSAMEETLVAAVASAIPTMDQPQPTDHFHFAPRITNPVLLQIGRTDWLSSPEDAETLRSLVPEGQCALKFYDAGHRLPPKFASDAAVWLIKKLK